MSLLGIDLGTSSVKVVLTDTGGAVRARASADYPVDRPRPGWAQTEPGLWWRAVRQAVHAVLETRPGDPPVAIGLSGQMHGVVLCDEDAEPVRPAVLWADARATAELDAYRALPRDVRRRLGNPLVPGMAGPVLAWLQRNEPDAVTAAAHALQPKDWLAARLTGRFAGEPSDASATLLYDVLAQRWDGDVLDALHLPATLLPELAASSGTGTGTLRAGAAADLRLPVGIPVAAGAADTAAAMLGSGLLETGQAQLTVGTGVQLVSTVDAPVRAQLPAEPVTHLYRAATRDGWYAMGASITGGQSLDWVRRMLGVGWQELYAAADRPLAGGVPADGGPAFLPYLAGERTPYLDTGIRGAWTGLDARHERVDLLRAALEGVAFAAADLLDALRARHPVPGPIRLAGGGTVAPGWRQLLADALGVALEPVEVPDASARGAALLAGLAAGVLDEAELAGSLRARAGDAVVPGPAAGPLQERREAQRAALARLYPETARLHPTTARRPS